MMYHIFVCIILNWRFLMNTAELSKICRQVRRDIITMTANVGIPVGPFLPWSL